MTKLDFGSILFITDFKKESWREGEFKIKGLFKSILSKIPVFLFCVIFIKIYNMIFEESNNIVGVILLIGIFMFMRGDFGFNVKQATVAIPVLFMIVGIAPKIAMINPFFGLIVNIISIGIILIVSSHDLSMNNHIPFMMGYIFCQGYDVSGKDFNLRLLSLLIGSVIIGGIYFAVNRKKEHKRSIINLFKEMNIHSTRTQWYIRLTLTLSLAMFIGDIINYPRTLWVSLTILSLTTPMINEHYSKSKVRVPAAVIGAGIFFVLFVLLIPSEYQPIVVLLAGFGSMFIQNYFIKSIYNSFSALGTAVLFFSAEYAILLRIISNLIGTTVAIGSFRMFNRFWNRFDKVSIGEDG